MHRFLLTLKSGIHLIYYMKDWIPAFAGMTSCPAESFNVVELPIDSD